MGKLKKPPQERLINLRALEHDLPLSTCQRASVRRFISKFVQLADSASNAFSFLHSSPDQLRRSDTHFPSDWKVVTLLTDGYFERESQVQHSINQCMPALA